MCTECAWLRLSPTCLSKYRRMKSFRHAILFAFVLFVLPVSAQETNSYGHDKVWSIKAGTGYFLEPMPMYSGYALWWQATYSLQSRLEFHARLGYATSSVLMSPTEIEDLWPADGYMGDHSKERKSYEHTMFELGASYPFIIGGRHRIAPGLGVLILHDRIHLPSHAWAVRNEGGTPRYYGWIGAPFYRSYFELNFSLQLEYTFHFSNGFFVGANAHCYYDFFGVNGITLSPVLGVRF